MFKYLKYLLALIFYLTVFGCTSDSEATAVDSHVIVIDSVEAPEKDSKISQKIAKYREPLEEEMERVIVHSEHAMEKVTPEGLLNNFVADLVFNIGTEIYEKPIDFCLLNYGGLRTSIPEGPVTVGRVYELMPFENEMFVVTLSPERTYYLFKYLAQSEDGMPVSGIKLGIKDDYPEVIKIDGEPFDDTRNYKVLTSDYLAHGGDDMDFFLQPINYELVGMMIRDAIIKHMENVDEQGEQITSSLDERIFYLN